MGFLFAIVAVLALARWAYVEYWKYRMIKHLPELQRMVGSSTPVQGANVLRALHEQVR